MRPLAPVLVLLAALSALPASAYRVETYDGRILEASALFRLDDGYLLNTEEGPVELPAGSVDFYSTFRANLEDGHGNALAFKRGGVLRFEAIEFDAGWITIELSEGLSFTVSESVVDFRATVLDVGVLELPEDYGGDAAVAKSVDRRVVRRGRRRR